MQQDQYPTKPIQLIVPAKAGGSTDTIARFIATKLQKILGQPVFIANVDGAGGSVASHKVKDAKNDGYTMLFQHNGLLVNNLMNIVNYSYEAFENGPILVRSDTVGLYSNAKGKYKDLETLISEVKKNPGTITYGIESGGVSNLMAIAFTESLGVTFKLVDVGPDALKRAALLRGRLDVAPGLYTTFKAQVDSQEFNCLCVFSGARSPFIPQIPTVKESGYNFIFDGYTFGFHFPKNTPPTVIATFANACETVSSDKEFKAETDKNFQTAVYMKPAEAATYWKNLQAQYDRYKDKVMESRKKN